MISRQEVLSWVKSLDPDSSVAIDEGGLMLVEINSDGETTDEYLEVGGEPDPEDL